MSRNLYHLKLAIISGLLLLHSVMFLAGPFYPGTIAYRYVIAFLELPSTLFGIK